MQIPRLVQKNIEENLFKGRIIILYGARRTGKTTVVKNILEKFSQNSFYFDFEDPENRGLFENIGVDKLQILLQKYKLVVFDEAQKLKNIGQTLKLIHDHLPKVQVIATGSSSFDLSNKINEPLTGRKFEFKLFPLSVKEIGESKSNIFVSKNVSNFLRFGSYPAILDLADAEAEKELKELSGSYLFKDVFTFQDLRNPELLDKLVRLLALQIGQEVSFHELATQLSVNEETVAKYIRLLEQAFVVFRLPAFSRNERKEISKSRKIYFYDLGIRNALIKNFNSLDLRNDVGGLWENFLVVERMKYLEYNQLNRNLYFWRTYDQKEIDLVEEYNGELHGYEFKWNEKAKTKVPKLFLETYPNSSFEVVTPANYLSFL